MKMIKEVLLHFGNRHQKQKVIEELAELIRAIAKDDRDNIIEEIADVEIMLSQLKLIYFIENEDIEKVKNEKLEKILYKIKSSMTYKG